MMKFHIEGGIQYMVPLTLLFLLNLGLTVYALMLVIQKKHVSVKLVEMIRHIAGIALAWGVLSTVIGLSAAFGSLSEMNESLPSNVIMGGMKVALITALYGLIIFVVSLTGYTGIKALLKTDVTSEP
jgi:hypothetical protein